MESLASWFAAALGAKVPAEAVVFIVSLLPVLECRGGLLVASLLGVDIRTALPITVIGNMIPIPFLLLFLRRLFRFLKRFRHFRPFVEKMEKRAASKSSALSNGEFLGLLLFVGIPLPGTGGWTGSMVAGLMGMKTGKALLAIFLGVLLATLIMAVVSYGLLGLLIR